jgi:hypothetical protein
VDAQHRLWRTLPPAAGYQPWPGPAEDYPTRRDRAVRRAWAELGLLERWRTTHEALAAGYDAEHLEVCTVCRCSLPTPVTESRCPACGTRWGRRYPRVGDVASLHDALAGCLLGAADLPPAAPVQAW